MPWSLRASICTFVQIFSISSSFIFFISSILPASFRSFLRVTGHIHGISSRIFFFILFIRAVLLAVIENLCDSSRAFCSTMSSGVPFSKSIGFFSPGRNISSSRFAIEQIGGDCICHCEARSNPCSVFSGAWIATLHSVSLHFVRDDGTRDWCWFIHIPSLTPDIALESCPFPQSMIIRWGKLSCSSHSSVRRIITSLCEAKSSISPSWRVFILYFLYLLVSGLPSTIQTRLA